MGIYNYWIKDKQIWIYPNFLFLALILFGLLHMNPYFQFFYKYLGGGFYIGILSFGIAVFNVFNGKGSLLQAMLAFTLMPLLSSALLYGIFWNQYGGVIGENLMLSLIAFVRIFSSDQVAILVAIISMSLLLTINLVVINSPFIKLIRSSVAISMNWFLYASEPKRDAFYTDGIAKRHKLEIILEKYGAKNPKIIDINETGQNYKYVVQTSPGTREEVLKRNVHDIRQQYGVRARRTSIKPNRDNKGAFDIEFYGAGL